MYSYDEKTHVLRRCVVPWWRWLLLFVSCLLHLRPRSCQVVPEPLFRVFQIALQGLNEAVDAHGGTTRQPWLAAEAAGSGGGAMAWDGGAAAGRGGPGAMISSSASGQSRVSGEHSRTSGNESSHTSDTGGSTHESVRLREQYAYQLSLNGVCTLSVQRHPSRRV